MKIAAAGAATLRLQLAEPYTIAYETFEHAVNCFVWLRTTDGTLGCGCASPAPEVTGETVTATEQALEIAAETLRGEDVGCRAELLERLRPTLAGKPAAAAAVEMALWDMAARSAGVPLFRLLGAEPRALPTSITIGICSLAETRQRARDHVERGFAALKIKGGASLEQDIERIRALRADLGGAVGLRFDANQGFGIEQTVRFVQATAECDLELLEQPVAARSDALGRLTGRLAAARSPAGSPLPPVMADESLLGIADAVHLATTGAVGAFNVKLMKVGGLAPARAVTAIAGAFGLEVMLSCMDEAALSIAAALHLALATPGIGWIDLDGHLDLLEDPTAGAVKLEAGCLSATDAAGLGASFCG